MDPGSPGSPPRSAPGRRLLLPRRQPSTRVVTARQGQIIPRYRRVRRVRRVRRRKSPRRFPPVPPAHLTAAAQARESKQVLYSIVGLAELPCHETGRPPQLRQIGLHVKGGIVQSGDEPRGPRRNARRSAPSTGRRGA